MKNDEGFFNIFWQMGAKQRLDILLKIQKEKSKPIQTAKEFDATRQEVSQNFEHLKNAELIQKDVDGYYHLTTFGKIACQQIKSLTFISNNQKYFKVHSFDSLPNIFKYSIASLESGQHIHGFVKIESKWKQIITNAKKYVKNILIEVPTSEEIVKTIVKQANQNVKFHSIFSESANIPIEERAKLLKKFKISELIQQNIVQKKMNDNLKVIVHLNEAEACVMFPNINDEHDFGNGFYSNSPDFHQWCLQYFDYCWKNSKPFQENKLKK